MLTRPMLAASCKDEKCLPEFPLLVTPKIDGVRALIVNGVLVSRSFKPIPNIKVRNLLQSMLPEGADGEITCGLTLYDTTSVVMSLDADVKNIVFSWFDWAFDLTVPYEHRMSAVMKYAREHRNMVFDATVIPLMPRIVNDVHELECYKLFALSEGNEGVVVRIPHGEYKCGRSTVREGLMIKIKQNADYEAVIVGTEELMHNMNDKTTDNFGNIKRRSAKEHLVAGNTLGALVVLSDYGKTFKIGTGFTADLRDTLWVNKNLIIGQLAKYKCTERNNKGIPRSPVFIGIRHQDDN